MARSEGLRLLDLPGDPLAVYLRGALAQEGLLNEAGPDVALPRLTGAVVCQVYSGVCRQETAERVLGALLGGRRVWCPWEGVEPLGRGPLGRLMGERLWTLRRSGLVLCPLGQLAARAAGRDERRGRRPWSWDG